MPTILMLPHRTFPSDHAMLETVYTRILPRRGYRIRWLMARGPGAPETPTASWNGTPVQLLEARKARTPIHEVPSRVAKTYRAASELLTREPVDIIQVRNDLTDAVAAVRLANRFKAKLVYQLSFPLGETRRWLAGGSLAERALSRARVAGALRLRRFIMERADLVLAISDEMRRRLVDEGLDPSRVVSVPLGADTSVSPNDFDKQAVRRELGLADAPTVIYVGTLERLRRLEFLLDAFALARARTPGAQLLVVGAGAVQGGVDEDRARLESATAARNLHDAVKFIGRVPRARVPAYLAASDVSVSPIPPLPFYTISSPTKVVESLAMSVPVVANREIPDQAQLLTESGGGIVVPYEAPPFAEAICAVLADPMRAKQMGARGREHIVATRSYEQLATELDGYYRSVLGTSTS